MYEGAKNSLAQFPIEVKWLGLPSEEILLGNHGVDTILLTYTLCNIPDWQRALEQMHAYSNSMGNSCSAHTVQPLIRLYRNGKTG